MKTSLSITLFLLFTASAAAGQTNGMGLFVPSEVPWSEGPASLQKGAQMAVLEGDPAREGPFTMRLRFPEGFEVSPHWHTQI